MINENLNIYDDLINIYDFIDVEALFSKTKELEYYKTIFRNDSSDIVNQYSKSLSDSDIVNIKVYQDIQNQYISTYLNDFTQYFEKIFETNENEVILETDNIETKEYKKMLYEKRMIDIIPYKIALVKNILTIKRFKGSLKYIELIVDFYVRMKYGQQLYTDNNEYNDIVTNGFLNIGTRYKIYNGNYDIYTKDNIFRVTSSTAISGFSVIPQFELNINKIDNTVYSISTIISLEEWETILKPIVHPLGYNDIFTQFNNNDSVNINMFVQHKNNTIYSNNDRYINIGYNNNNKEYRLFEIGNISNVDKHNTAYSGIKNSCYSLTQNNIQSIYIQSETPTMTDGDYWFDTSLAEA